jgi:D-glycero-alpha-D-manno-heptose-7-phosphate kinase
MIISKTPFRISFFGGGTDYPQWYRENGGVVLSTTIDKYCYLTCRYLPPFFDHRFRVSYSVIELAKEAEDIKHPSVRECLIHMGVRDGVEIHYDGDLPARTGLGSSSAFTVGLLKSLYALQGRLIDNVDLGREAVHVEQDLIRENVGSQDQMATAVGGFNHIFFGPGDRIVVQPFVLPRERMDQLNSHLMLFFTGFARNASEIARDVIQNVQKKKDDLAALQKMPDQAARLLAPSGADLEDFGRLLHEGWMRKRGLSPSVSTSYVDEFYQAARAAGATGGKLMGAGGGGFVVLFVKPDLQKRVKEALRRFLYVPFSFENDGCQIVHYRPDERGGWAVPSALKDAPDPGGQWRDGASS